MNQPTREEFEAFKAELRAEMQQEVRKIKEQHTEEMRVTRIEVASDDVTKRLDRLEEGQQRLETSMSNHTELLKEHDEQLTLIYTDVGHMKADVGILKQQMKEARADITAVKATQSDHGELLREILARLPEKGE